MSEIELLLPAGLLPADVEKVVEACCAAEGLAMRQKGSLARYPGCTHWHYQRPGQAGTLEITYWPPNGRLWFPMRPNRSKAWVEAAVPILKEAIEKGLKRET